ncbi:hypothetical protein AC781_12890 [Akkermansia glycaniphila]|nr:hypothetical protein AC781_12890 [Akkermansia glycaniphila]
MWRPWRCRKGEPWKVSLLPAGRPAVRRTCRIRRVRCEGCAHRRMWRLRAEVRPFPPCSGAGGGRRFVLRWARMHFCILRRSAKRRSGERSV